MAAANPLASIDFSTLSSKEIALPHGHRKAASESLPTDRPHIRVLVLLAFSKDNIPVCALGAVPLGEYAFTALSYTWGPPPATKRILVNGRWRCVRANLYDFLRRGAGENYMRTPLFVDALCIKQWDREEKQVQVQLMGDVYRRAEKVIVWLPPPPDREEDIFGLDAAMFETAVDNLQKASPTPNPSRQNETQSLLSSFIPSEFTLYAATVIRAFSANPFWTRLWILQELILARNLLIQIPGAQAVPLEVYEQAFRAANPVAHPDGWGGVDYTRIGFAEYALGPCRTVLGGDGNFQYQPLVALSWRRKTREGPTGEFQRQPLYELVAAFNGQQASVQKDMIFGMLGMADTHIVADYSASITDLFTHVLTEGLRGVEARPDRGNAEGGIHKMQDFHVGIMNAFGFSAFDLAAQVIVREALRMCVRHDDIAGKGRDARFREFWAIHLYMRPHPLIERSWWGMRVLGLQDRVLYFLDAMVRFVSYRVSGMGKQFWLSYWRYEVQRILLCALERWKVELRMPDGEKHTVVEWENRVREIGRLVEEGVPPRGRPHPPPQQQNTPPETPQVVPAEERWIRQLLEAALVGYVLDQLFVVLLSLPLAWLSVQLGPAIDGFFAATIGQVFKLHEFRWLAFVPHLWILLWSAIYYVGVVLLVIVLIVGGLASLLRYMGMSLLIMLAFAAYEAWQTALDLMYYAYDLVLDVRDWFRGTHGPVEQGELDENE